MNPINLLANASYFMSSSGIVLNAVAEICIPRTVKKKEMLFFEGSKGTSLFLAATATVQLYKTDSEGKAIVVRLVEPGQLFAEVILFEQDKYPVNAMVVKSGLVFVLPRDQFLILLGNEEFRTTFIGDIMKKQRYLAEKIQQISSFSVEQRFFFFLRDHYGMKQEYTLTLSKKSIAETIGTSAETFSRMVLKLKKEGKIDLVKNKLILHDNFWNTWFVE